MSIILWILTLEILGIITHLLIFNLFKNFSYLGFCIAKPLFLLLFGGLTWALHALTTIEISPITLMGLVFVYVAFCIYFSRRFIVSYINSLKSNSLIIGYIFCSSLIIFGIFLLIKSLDPSISHTEQPMDFAFLNAIYNTYINLPMDPWFKGEIIHYYYFGYWIFGKYGTLLYVPPQITYNLAIISIPYLSFSAISGILIYLINLKPIRFKNIIVPTIFASSSLIFLGNLYTPLKMLQENFKMPKTFWDLWCVEGLSSSEISTNPSLFPQEFWWWFKSTRIINHFGNKCDQPGVDYTINEFPFFSFLLGDLHPHVMSIPFVITFIIFAIIIAKTPKVDPIKNIVYFILLGLIGWSITFISVWNISIIILIITGISLLKILNYQNYSKKQLIIFISLLVAISAILILPLINSFGSSIHGIYATNIQSDFSQELIIWFPFLLIHFIYLSLIICRHPIGKNWKKSLLVSVIVATSPAFIALFLPSINPELTNKTFTGFIFLFFSATSIFYTFSLNQNYLNHKSVIPLALIGVAFFMLAIPEFVFLGDIFNNRMNTIFKSYYLAWILFSITSGICLYEIQNVLIRKTIVKKISLMSVILIPFLLGVLYIPATVQNIVPNSYKFSIDGFSNIKNYSPHTYNAIFYAKKHIPPEEGILESVGEWSNFGVISSNTGISNIINWPDHEKQWRGDNIEIQSRVKNVDIIYKTTNPYEARQLLDLYGISFIFIGQNESIKYNPVSLKKFNLMATTIFSETYNGQEIKIMKLNNE